MGGVRVGLHPGAVLAPRARAARPSPRLGMAARAGRAGPTSTWSASPRRHRRPPPAPCVPPIPVAPLPLPRRALYEAWHARSAGRRSSGPPARSTSSTPPRSSSRPDASPLVVTVHDLAFLHDPGASPATASAPSPRRPRLRPRHADLVLCSSRSDARRLPSPPGSTRDAAARPVGRRPGRADRRPRSSTPCGAGSASPIARTCCSSARSSPARTWPACWRPTARSTSTHAAGRRRAGGLGRRAHRRAGERPAAGLRRRGDEGRALRGRRRGLLPEPARGLRPARLEAMAHGAPVVTVAGTATAEVGGDAVVLVDPLRRRRHRGAASARPSTRRAELAAAGPVAGGRLHVGRHGRGRRSRPTGEVAR